MPQALLRTNRPFRLLFSAASVSNLGDGIAVVALPWLATLLTRDPVMVSAVAMAGRLPWFLFALPAGVWTDRADRRRLMVRADLARVMLTMGVVGMVLSLPGLPLVDDGGWAVMALALVSFLVGTAEVIHDNAAQTFLPSIVAGPDLERANSQLWSAEKVTGQFLGPPLAGVLIAAGIALPFGVNAATFAASAGLIALIAMPPRPPRPGTDGRRFRAELAEGLAWTWANRPILRLAVLLGLINGVAVGGMTVLVLYAQEVLGLSSAAYGTLLTCAAAGGVAGGLVAPRLAAWLGMRRSLLAALAAFAGGNLLLGCFGSVPLAALALFADAFAGMLWNVVTVSYRQRLIPDGLLGRVNSVYRFFGWGSMPFGALGAGALVALAEPSAGRLAALHAPYLVAAAVCAALFFYGLARLRFD